MKTIIYILISLAAAATSFADNGLNGNALNGGLPSVPDSSSSALLLGMALVASLLVGRKFIKK